MPPPGARVALVHHWMVRRRGGERCLEVLARLLPGADLLTLVHDPRACPAPAGVARVITTPLQRLPLLRRHFRALLPILPWFYGCLDLSGYDLVVSSDAALAKTVAVPPGVPHLCYCYSPPRYAWDLAGVYLERAVAAPLRPAARAALARVRRLDAEAAARVDRFVAISHTVAARIAHCYDRPAEVVHPPVDTAYFHPGETSTTSDIDPSVRPYLLLGEAVPYKGFELGVLACRRVGRPLVVAGGGPMWRRLRRLAGPLTRFVADPDDAQVRELYRGCRALLFPGEEDFGLVPVEAMACGRPVIALGRGGATETIVHGATGLLYEEDGVDGLCAALRDFERWEGSFRPSRAVARAGIFCVDAHERAMGAVIATL